MSSRPVFLHIGASKTGTSALQRGLFDSAKALQEQGLGMPLKGRDAHIQQVLRPLGWVTASGFVRDVDTEALEKLGPKLAGTRGERLLLTCEDLCEADSERIAALADVVRRHGGDPHVVLSVRGLASVVPSEWQQFLKHRLPLDYPTFLERLRDRKGRWAKHFWLRQDVEEICTRWADVVGIDHVQVVVTPDRRVDPDGLYRMFGDVLGFDPDSLSWPTRDVNASWGYTEAEVYRRVNEALEMRLPRYEADYQPGVRWPFVQGVLPRGASERIPLPRKHLPWVSDVAQRHVDYLEDSGVRFHGDPSLLVPTADDIAELPVIDEAEIAKVAVETLANMSVYTLERQRQRRGRKRRQAQVSGGGGRRRRRPTVAGVKRRLLGR